MKLSRTNTRLCALACIIAIGGIAVAADLGWSQTVKITPLGSHDGEFCRNDRAIVFEDPDGTRVL